MDKEEQSSGWKNLARRLSIFSVSTRVILEISGIYVALDPSQIKKAVYLRAL